MSHVTTIPFDFQPIVIIGAARSGTNMLRNALTHIEGFVTWPCDEINYVWRHGWASWPNDELTASHATRRVRQFIRATFRRLADSSGAKWIVEKTCANSLRVDFVRAVLPEAKFVFLVRDGRDVVASAMKRWQAGLDIGYVLRKARFVPPGDAPYYALRYLGHHLYRFVSRERRLPSWGPRFEGIDAMRARRSIAEVSFEQWRRCVELAAAVLSTLPPARVHALRYEQLAAEPAVELGRIAEFLGVPLPPGRLKQIAGEVLPTSIGGWRNALEPQTLATIEQPAEETLARLERCGLLPHAPTASQRPVT